MDDLVKITVTRIDRRRLKELAARRDEFMFQTVRKAIDKLEVENERPNGNEPQGAVREDVSASGL